MGMPAVENGAVASYGTTDPFLRAKGEPEVKGIQLFTLVVTWLVVFCCGGTVYGWAPLQVMLEDAGAFAEDCEGETTECTAEGAQLALVYALAAGALEFNGFPAGILLDRIGPARAMSFFSVLMVASLVLVAIFPIVGSWVLFPGFILCGLTGIGILLVGFSATGLVPSRYATYVIMFTTCFFDSSTIMPLVVSKFYGMCESFEVVFGCYALFCALLLAAASWGWHECVANGLYRLDDTSPADSAAVHHAHPNASGSGGSATAVTAAAVAKALAAAAGEAAEHKTADDETFETDGYGDGYGPLHSQQHTLPGSANDSFSSIALYGRRGSGMGENLAAGSGTQTPAAAAATTPMRRRSVIEDLPVAHLSLAKQVVSKEFLLSLAFYNIHVLRANAYIGYLDEYLRDIGAPAGGFYENTIGGMIALGFLWVPIVDWVVSRTGLGWTAQLMNVIGAVYLAFLMTNELWAQWPAVVVYGLYRAFVFGFPPILALEVFGPATFGRISGLLFTVGGIPTLAAYPLTAWGKSGAWGGWRGVNGFLLAITVFAVVPAAWLQLHSVEAAFRPPAKASSDATAAGAAAVGGGSAAEAGAHKRGGKDGLAVEGQPLLAPKRALVLGSL